MKPMNLTQISFHSHKTLPRFEREYKRWAKSHQIAYPIIHRWLGARGVPCSIILQIPVHELQSFVWFVEYEGPKSMEFCSWPGKSSKHVGVRYRVGKNHWKIDDPGLHQPLNADICEL